MSIYVKDQKTDRAVRKLAKLRGTTLTEAICAAVETELEREKQVDLEAETDRLIAKVAGWPDTKLKADKAFYDGLYED